MTSLTQLFWAGLMLGGVGLLLWAPLALYKRYRRLYAGSESFALRWVEPGPDGAFRGGDHEMAGRFEVSAQLEWTAKFSFFLGILGFFWTPLVLLGAVTGLTPMVTIGLPGLVVSWSIFFAARSVMIRGPAAVGWLRKVAVGEIVMNLWVLAVVVLATLGESRASGPEFMNLVKHLLTLGTSSNFEVYSIPYSMKQGGVLAVGYALMSFGHAAMALHACTQLDRAQERQQGLVEA